MGNVLGGQEAGRGTNDLAGDLRSKADQLFQKRKLLSQQSQEAYQRGDKARAKVLSLQAKDCEKEARVAQVRGKVSMVLSHMEFCMVFRNTYMDPLSLLQILKS